MSGNNTINKLKKETMFIQMLEGLQEKDADVLMSIKNKNLNNLYKGLTANLVKETLVGMTILSESTNKTHIL